MSDNAAMQDLDGMSSKQGSIKPSARDDESSMLATEDMPVDVKKLKGSLNEQAEMLKIVKEFEQVYFDSKGNYNKLDAITMNSDITMKSLRHCFKLNQKHLMADDPDFDKPNMKDKLDQLYTRVQDTNTRYNGVKGAEMLLSEQIINKDTSAFKLIRVAKARREQVRFFEKMDDIDDNIYAQEKEVNEIWQTYEDFNEELFRYKLGQGDEKKGEVGKFLGEIEQQMARMQKDYDKIMEDMDIVQPYTEEHKLRITKIQMEICAAGDVLKAGAHMVEKERKAEKRFEEASQECHKLVDLIDKLNDENDLVKLVEIVDRLGELVENLHEWREQYKRLKALREDQIQPAIFSLEKNRKSLDKWIADVRKVLRETFIDLMEKIKKQGASNKVNVKGQQDRLDDFEERNLNDPTVCMNIAKADLLFLKKEVTRYDVSIGMVTSICETMMERCQEIEEEKNSNAKLPEPVHDIDPETLHTLTRNLKHLESQDTVEIPRIKKNIDQLEAYNIKALKNKLNDDNKKSQSQISAMKKRFEDLQKYIDALNSKVVLVRKNIAALNTQFNDEDIEKDNDFKNNLEAKVDICDLDINGDKENRAVDAAVDDGGYSESKLNLISRKKQIIAAINKMVNQFNENNKLIKDSNKTPKTDTEINAIIQKSLDLQQFCADIDKKVCTGKDFAQEIEIRLDLIIDPRIPETVEKFTEKNNFIDDCDELFDANEAKVNKLEELLKTKIGECDALIQKVTNVSPLEQPGIEGKASERFVKIVSDNMDKAQGLLQEYRDCQASLVKLQDKLMDDIQPLNELGEREVKTPEIEAIMEKMKVLGIDFDELERLIAPLAAKLQTLDKEINDMINDEKKGGLGEANDMIKALNDKIAALELLKSDAGKKLEEYNNEIDTAKDKFGDEDPMLADALQHHGDDAGVIAQTIKDLEGEIADLVGVRDELKKISDDAFEKPDEFTPKQIADLADKVKEQNEKADQQNKRQQAVCDDLDKRIDEVKKLCANSKACEKLKAKGKELGRDGNNDIKSIKDMLDKLPKKISDMLASLEEQKKDTLPDVNTADYFEKKKDIDQKIKALLDLQGQVDKVAKDFPGHENEFGGLLKDLQSTKGEFEVLKDLVDQIQVKRDVLGGILTTVKDFDKKVDDIKTDMGDCLIPINIAKRAKEISDFAKKINDLNTKFLNFKNTELNDTGANEYQQEIRDIIGDMMERLDEADMDKRDLKQFQKSTLEAYGQKDFVSPENAPLIAEVRTHKEDIVAAVAKLRDLDDFFKDAIARKDQFHQIDTLKTKCDKELDALNEILDKYPEQIQKMLETLEEELKDASGKGADYFEKKAEIETMVISLNDCKSKIDKIDEEFPSFEDKIEEFVALTRDNKEIDNLKKVVQSFEDLYVPISNEMKTAKTVIEKVTKIKDQMGECLIPDNIMKRANDITTFDDGLKKIKDQFERLKAVDEDIDEDLMNPESEAEIRKLVLDIDAKIYDFDQERDGFSNMQTEVLEKYTQKDFVSLDNAPIISEVREHKRTIDDAIARLKELGDLVQDALSRKEAYKVINELGDSLQADLCALKDMFGNLPDEVEGMLLTLQEMYNGSVGEENDDPDYADLRQDIEEWIFELKKAKTSMQSVSGKYTKKEKECLLLLDDAKEPTDTEGLEKLKERFSKMKADIDGILNEAEGCNNSILDIRNQMGECLIPENITKRANEIDTFKEKINRITYDFFDFKIEYAKSSRLSTEMKKSLKVLIDEIDRRIYGFDEEKKEFIEFQKNRLETYTNKDFVSLENPPIIVEIREFKARIGDAKERLKDLEAFIDECVTKKESYQVINTLNKDIDLDLHNLREFFNTLPGEIQHMLKTLDEMAQGAEPNASADYFELKTKIGEQTKSVKETLGKIKVIEGDFNKKLIEVGVLVGESKKQLSVAKLQKLSRDYEREKTVVQEVLQAASACRDTIDYIKSEMDECEIPRTINLRAQEIEQFNIKFDQIQSDFVEIKSTNIEDNSSDSKAAIRAFIDEINKRLYGLDEEKIEFVEYQKSTLEQYGPKDFSDLKNAPIIASIRDHKLKILEAYEKLEDLEAFVNQSKAKKISLIKIDKLAKECKLGTDQLQGIIVDAPRNVQRLAAVLKEMLLAAAPMKGYLNETADYWKEKDEILKQQGQLGKTQQEIDKIDEQFADEEDAVKSLVDKSKNNDDIGALTNIANDLEKQKDKIIKTLKLANDITQNIKLMTSEVGDARIPITIKSRSDEINNYQNKLVEVKNSFSELQVHVKEEADKKRMNDMSQKITGFDKDSSDMVNTQLNKCNNLNRENFLDLDQSVGIIPMVKKHKDHIADAVERLRILGELIKRTHDQICSQGDIAGLADQLQQDIASLKEVLGDLPPKIQSMLKTLEEMKNGSTPDDTADYWEERQAIADNTQALLNAQSALNEIEDQLNQKESDILQQVAKSKKTQDIPTLQGIQQTLENYRNEITDILNRAYDQKDVVTDTKDKMGECEIPVNIAMRANEIDQYREKLDRINEDFKDLKQADEDFDGTSESEAEIKTLIAQIDKSIKGFEAEKQEFNRYHKSKFARYSKPDFLSYDNAPIIVEVREFKAKISDAYARLKDLDDLTNDLNSKLIVQDIENATKLLEVKNHKLRERLEIAQKELGKINKCGDEMDGNCSRNEEEEFIEALKDEMPEVFKNIDGNFEQITKVDQIIIEIQKTKSIEMMQTLKLEVDDASIKVEQCEGLVNKLENEIIEWDALRKLCRRDEELEEIDHLLRDFQSDLENESNQMYPKLEQNSKKLELSTSPADIQDFTKLVEGIKEYVGDVEKLTVEVNSLLTEKEECFDEFDNDVPIIVKRERDIRRKQKQLVMTPSRRGRRDGDNKSSGSQFGEDDKPTDMYYMIEVNCSYRKRIHEMLKNLRELNKKRRELEDKWGPFKRELNKVKEVKVYKPVKGDAIDELFAFHLNKHQLNLPIKRLGPGKYLFGTKQILAKIINGKLVIRVGGGYMSADEFIEQYGPMEILKIQQAEEKAGGDGSAHVGVGGARNSMAIRASMRSPKSGTDMARMKEQMRDQMNNIKVYGDDPTLNTQGSPNNRMSLREAQRRASGAGGSPRASQIGMSSPKGRRSPKN